MSLLFPNQEQHKITRVELIFDENMFGELKDENYELRHKWCLLKLQMNSRVFVFFFGGSVDSASEDGRAFLKEPEFYPVKCVGCFLKAVIFSRQ